MAGSTFFVVEMKALSHDAVDALCRAIGLHRKARIIVLDLRLIEDASTAAFARLVLFRRQLLKTGMDLRLSGLHARAADIWRINRLDRILPAV